MRFRAVIFDLDGTLLDTLAGIAEAGNRVLALHDVATHPTDEYRYYVGDGVRRLFERILPEKIRAEEKILQCIDDFRRIYRETWDLGTRPYDGVNELLAKLTEMRVKMSVLSNKPDEFVGQCVRDFLPDVTFERVFGDRDGTAPKPDPTGALEIIDRIGLPTEDFVYLGDTATDMKTALAASVTAVGATWGFRPREELLDAGAHHLIESPMELVDLIRSNSR